MYMYYINIFIDKVIYIKIVLCSRYPLAREFEINVAHVCHYYILFHGNIFQRKLNKTLWYLLLNIFVKKKTNMGKCRNFTIHSLHCLLKTIFSTWTQHKGCSSSPTYKNVVTQKVQLFRRAKKHIFKGSLSNEFVLFQNVVSPGPNHETLEINLLE